MSKRKRAEATAVRCAIYTRKSTEEGLEQEFNTLDAQREAGEAYIATFKHENWVCLPDRYDDGGFTGGNMERPALKRLMADIESGKVNCVVVYKVDRLSRSLLDFARMMETFERYDVSFVSVTQQFNTASSMGRLMLNVLLSFAQFEREMISERTRDKMAAARRKGKWVGGMPLLGYDVLHSKLIVNEVEAQRVREIFGLYLEIRSLSVTAQELNRRGWRTKVWITKKGTRRGGRKFDKVGLHHLLTNITYLGKLRFKGEIYEGEHPAIVDEQLFQDVQLQLEKNSHGGAEVRNKYGALLRGLIYCSCCDCRMTHSFTARGQRRYRYYLCQNAQRNGWHSCPAPSVPASEIEQFVVEQIRGIGHDPAVLAATLAHSRRGSQETLQSLKDERTALLRQRVADDANLGRLAVAPDEPEKHRQIAMLNERLVTVGQRLKEIDAELDRLRGYEITESEVTAALADFDTLWSALAPREQARVLELLIERVEFDGQGGNVALTFRPTGIQALTSDATGCEETTV